MNDFDAIFREVGFPAALFLFTAWAFVKYIWPFAVKAWEDQQLERRQEREKFLQAIDEHRAGRDQERQQFLDAIAMARKSFTEIVAEEREIRIIEREKEREARLAERDKFLDVIDKYTAQYSSQLTTLAKALEEIRQAMENGNGEKR